MIGRRRVASSSQSLKFSRFATSSSTRVTSPNDAVKPSSSFVTTIGILLSAICELLRSFDSRIGEDAAVVGDLHKPALDEERLDSQADRLAVSRLADAGRDRVHA